jgi:hypothetical protein
MLIRFHDEWQALLSLEPWCPLDTVPFERTHLGALLYQLSDIAYLYAVPRDPDLKPTLVPRVTVIMWAANPGVARRVALHEIEADQDHRLPHPPVALLPTGATFRDVKAFLEDEPKVRTSMSLTYRIATDGKHIQTSLNHGSTQYIFRSVDPKDADPCIAITVRLAKASSRGTR